MGLLEMIPDGMLEEDIILQGSPQERIRERLAPILAKSDAADYYHLVSRDLNIAEPSAGSAGSSKILHRQFFSPVTGDNFGKMGTGKIESDPLLGSGVYGYLGLLGDLKFDADAVQKARKEVEQRPGINRYGVFNGNNCVDYSMNILDAMMRQKTGEGLGWD